MAVVREPLDKLNPKHSELDPWEIVMYVLGLAFSFDGEVLPFWLARYPLNTMSMSATRPP